MTRLFDDFHFARMTAFKIPTRSIVSILFDSWEYKVQSPVSYSGECICKGKPSLVLNVKKW